MIRELEFYHGSVFARLILESPAAITLRQFSPRSSSAYVVNDTVGIYIKYSTKRMSPWRFTFLRSHQDEIAAMSKSLKKVFLVLVCEGDGFASISFDELKGILDHDHKSTEWISATRRRRHQYTVKGSDGDLDFKVSHVDFARRILNAVEELSVPAG